jgi:hypothetical protein
MSVHHGAVIYQHRSSPVHFLTAEEQAEYDASVERSKAANKAERLEAARVMGIPRDLIALCEVDGRDQVTDWLKAYDALKAAQS